MTPETWSALAAWAAVIVAICAAVWAAANGKRAHNEASAARASGDEAQQANLDAQRASRDAQEQIATSVGKLADLHALPDVTLSIERGQLGNTYDLVNTGTHPATGVKIDTIPDVHTERLPDGVMVEPGERYTFVLVRSPRTFQLGHLAVKCNELPRPALLPLPFR